MHQGPFGSVCAQQPDGFKTRVDRNLVAI